MLVLIKCLYAEYDDFYQNLFLRCFLSNSVQMFTAPTSTFCYSTIQLLFFIHNTINSISAHEIKRLRYNIKKVVLQEVYVVLNWKIKINMNWLRLWPFILFATVHFVRKENTFIQLMMISIQYLLSLQKGVFWNLILERSKKEKSDVVKFWRAKGKFEIKDDVLRYNGENVSLIITSF